MLNPINFGVFKRRTGLDIPVFNGATEVVPFRSIVRIINLQIMPVDYLVGLLRAVTLEGKPEVRPYQNAIISRVRTDPRSLTIGQTFAQRDKCRVLTENLTGLFNNFCTTSGYAKLSPYIVLGETSSGEHAISHYLPPIIEIHNGKLCLIDGIHRNVIIRAAGTTIESIIIENISSPPPCAFGSWDSIKFVDEKPPRPERFLDLHPEFFRNLGWSGIDG